MGFSRVNKKNEFNTPIGSYGNPIICDDGKVPAPRVVNCKQIKDNPCLKH